MKPVIFGCAGPVLSDNERIFFQEQQPAGFILFARNVQNPQQLKALTTDLRLSVDRADVFILIDQEGGRVQRMTEPHWRKYPPMQQFGLAAMKDADLAKRALTLNCQMIADDLHRVGINTDCLPLLDVPVTGADKIIGDRAFANSPKLVAELGQIVIDTFMNASILPVMKHVPGHGRAAVDSHLALPVVDTTVDDLAVNDFSPFQAVKNCPLAMTAHVVYTALDRALPATLSSTVIEDIIRGHMGFKGLLMTDDISMQALNGHLGDLASQSLAAGCDLVLHCNGEMQEMQEIAAAVDQAPARISSAVTACVAQVSSAAHTDRIKLEQDYNDAMASIGALL